MAMAQGVYVSRLDLNMEHGRYERPLKPVLRFAAPVGPPGRRLGVVVLNYLGSNILDMVRNVSDEALGRTVLVNSSGGYLVGYVQKDEWSFLLEPQGGRSLPPPASRGLARPGPREQRPVSWPGDRFVTHMDLRLDASPWEPGENDPPVRAEEYWTPVLVFAQGHAVAALVGNGQGRGRRAPGRADLDPVADGQEPGPPQGRPRPRSGATGSASSPSSTRCRP